ncbi:NYN domain-containing protein [Candidatus Gracilibacteria bacterium]|nr:NYN domain-containing protein [Candidatus Gracilibacteria bacterium]
MLSQEELSAILKGRVSVFIDASNVFFINKKLRVRIDYAKVLQFFRTFDPEAKCYLYTAFQEGLEKQTEYLDDLVKSGLVVRRKPLKFITTGPTAEDKEAVGFYKGNMDVELVIDAIRLMSQYDTFVLFSGDSDFFALLKYLEEHDKKVVVLSRYGFVAEELKTIGNFIDISQFLRRPSTKRAPKQPKTPLPVAPAPIPVPPTQQANTVPKKRRRFYHPQKKQK